MSFMHDIGDIDFPEDWTQHTIEEVAHFSRGLSWAKRDETDKDNGNLVVSIPNVRDGHIDFESKFNHYLGCPIPEAKRLRVGDIVFVGSSGSLQNVGRNAKVRELPTPVVAFASFTFKATPDREVIDPDFFYHLVNSDLVPFEDYCSRAADGKFNFQLVDFKSKQQLRLPGKEEQQRIAQVLSTVQEAIAQQERLMRTTTELKQALMQKLFTEGLRGEALKETEIGRVPESWDLVPVGQLFYTQLGKMLSPKARRGSEPKPYLRNKNVQWDGIDTDDLHLMDFDDREMEKFRLEPGDLLVCEGGEVGRTALWKGEVAECYYQKALHRLRPRDASIRPAFMAYWMRYAFQMHNVYGVTGTRTTIAHLPEIKLTPLPVPLPSIDEQDEMLAALEGTDRKLDHTRHKLTALQDLFRTLLHELMTGKVRTN